jgi:hypothetical protein
MISSSAEWNTASETPRRAVRCSFAALALCALALGLSGCEQTPERPESDEPPVNLSGYSKDFREGFKHGCNSARGRKARRDDKRYTSDTQYARGWDDGHAICARR